MTTPVLQSRLPAVGTTVFTLMSALAGEYGAVNLGQGFPDFACDPRRAGLAEQPQQRRLDGGRVRLLGSERKPGSAGGDDTHACPRAGHRSEGIRGTSGAGSRSVIDVTQLLTGR